MKEKLFSVTKKDYNIQYFSGTGAGGQHRNKHQNWVRLIHNDSGTTTTGQSSKSREANLKEAFNNLVNHPSFKVWLNRKIYEKLTNETIEQKVDKMLNETNLRIEEKVDGKWQELKEPGTSNPPFKDLKSPA